MPLRTALENICFVIWGDALEAAKRGDFSMAPFAQSFQSLTDKVDEVITGMVPSAPLVQEPDKAQADQWVIKRQQDEINELREQATLWNKQNAELQAEVDRCRDLLRDIISDVPAEFKSIRNAIDYIKTVKP